MQFTYKDINNQLIKIAKKEGRVYFEILYLFLMERFLARLSKSRFADQFVLKGGFLIIKRWAPYSRTTRDLDFVVQKIPKAEVVSIINEICAINVGDGIEYNYQKDSDIMTGDVYEGIRYVADALIGGKKIQEKLRIDIGFSDKPFPDPLPYSFTPEIAVTEGEDISILVYGKEAVLAEKIESLVSKADKTTRMRDIYDIWKIIDRADDKEILKTAIEHVFKIRNSSIIGFEQSLGDSFVSRVEPLWDVFLTKNKLEDLDIREVLNLIVQRLKKLDL